MQAVVAVELVVLALVDSVQRLHVVSSTHELTIFDVVRQLDAEDVAVDSLPLIDLDLRLSHDHSRDVHLCMKPDDRDHDVQQNCSVSNAWMSLMRCYYSSSHVVSLCMCQ